MTLTIKELNVMNELIVSWEDGSYWAISWFQEDGCYFAQRWLPDPGEDNFDGPFIETPGPDVVTVEDLTTLEAVMGRPLPGPARHNLEAEARSQPFTDEKRRAWCAESAAGITRWHPVAGWIDTLAPPGHPDPFADHWLPEAEAWYLDKLLAGESEPEGRP